MARTWSGWKKSPTSNTANDEGTENEATPRDAGARKAEMTSWPYHRNRTIDFQRHAGDAARIVGSQENGRGADLLGRGQALQRRLGAALFPAGGVDHAVRARRGNRPGRDGVDADAVRRKLHRLLPGERVDRSLDRGIDRGIRNAE